MSTSASYAIEVAKYLQLEHNVENPDIAEYYFFDLGEPAFAGKQALTDTLKAGNSYDVTVQVYDRNNAAVEGAACEFTLRK